MYFNKIILFFGLFFIAILGFSNTNKKENSNVFMDLGKHFQIIFDQLLPHYKIVSYCIGSFKDMGADEYALAVVDPKNTTTKYVALLYNSKGKPYTLTLAKFPINKNTQENEKYLQVDCKSAMEIRRLNSTIKATDIVNGELNPINEYDSICISDILDITTSSCFSYNHNKGKFIKIGEWTT